MAAQPSNTPSTPNTPELDREIVAALIHKEQALLDDLHRRGLTEAALNERAGQLGLTSELIKRCRLAGTQPSLRTCVKCDARFLSAGPHNRLCRRCPPR